MKVLLVNGSPHNKGCTNAALNEAGQDVYKRQVVECHLAKVKVEGSNPFARSIKKLFARRTVFYFIY